MLFQIRIVLNKCDLVTPQQLMRVYGALMWSLGKVMDTPEVRGETVSSKKNREQKNVLPNAFVSYTYIQIKLMVKSNQIQSN